MPPVTPQPHRASSTRRRTVRIVKRRTTSRATTISLALAVAAALLLPVVWRLWQGEEAVRPHKRSLADAVLTLRCEKGHQFRAKGHTFGVDGFTDAKTCWRCGEPAYPFAQYVCPVHGAYEVTVRFAEGEDGVEIVSQIRLTGREWVSSEEGVRCPRCNRRLEYSKDPLIGLRHGL